MKNALISLVFFCCGCGAIPTPLGTKDARCDLRPDDDQCTDLRDFPGPSLLTFEQVCNTLKMASGSGTYEEGARCDLTDAWGGCQSESMDGTKQTNWYYRGESYPTEEEAKAECAGGQSWVAPN